MNHLIFVMMISSEPSEDLVRNVKALEIYLQDQEDHKEYCPKLEWDQPDIEVYKKNLKSYLPEKCKKE